MQYIINTDKYIAVSLNRQFRRISSSAKFFVRFYALFTNFSRKKRITTKVMIPKFSRSRIHYFIPFSKYHKCQTVLPRSVRYSRIISPAIRSAPLPSVTLPRFSFIRSRSAASAASLFSPPQILSIQASLSCVISPAKIIFSPVSKNSLS